MTQAPSITARYSASSFASVSMQTPNGEKELQLEAGLALVLVPHLGCFPRHLSDIAGVPLLVPILYPCNLRFKLYKPWA